MSFGAPKIDSPPPPPNPPTQANAEVLDAGRRQRLQAGRGFASTLLTSSQGVLSQASTTKSPGKTLLGG